METPSRGVTAIGVAFGPVSKRVSNDATMQRSAEFVKPHNVAVIGFAPRAGVFTMSKSPRSIAPRREADRKKGQSSAICLGFFQGLDCAMQANLEAQLGDNVLPISVAHRCQRTSGNFENFSFKTRDKIL